MMDGVVTFAVTFKGDCAVGPGLLEVAIAGAEMVMQGTFLPNAVLLSRPDEMFHIQIREDFEEEHAAEQGQEQFLVHDDGRHGDDATDGQATRVAHEDLGGIRIEPQETDEGTHESSHEDDKFFAARDIHQIEVARCDCVTGNIS